MVPIQILPRTRVPSLVLSIIYTSITCLLLLSVVELDNGVLAGPAPRQRVGVTLLDPLLLELLVLARLEAHNHIGLASSERQNVDIMDTQGTQSSVERGISRPLGITCELSVVEISLEDDKSRVLEILPDLRTSINTLGVDVPEEMGSGPEGGGSDGQRAIIEVALELGDKVVNLFSALGEERGVLEVVDGLHQIDGEDIRNEPGDVLGVQNDVLGELGVQEEQNKRQIGVQFEAGVIENDIDSRTIILLGIGVEDVPGLFNVVDENLLLVLLSHVSSLQVLDLVQRHGGQKRQVSGVTPQRDIGKLLEQLLERSLFGDTIELLGQSLVSGGELGNTGRRGLEGILLLSAENVVGLPVLGLVKVGLEFSVEVALDEDPSSLEPRGGVFLEETVVDGDVVGHVGKLLQRLVMLNIVLESGDLLEHLFELVSLLALGSLGHSLVDIVNDSGENVRPSISRRGVGKRVLVVVEVHLGVLKVGGRDGGHFVLVGKFN